MNSHDFLKTQLQLLTLQFGRRAVMEALAAASDASYEQLTDQLAQLAAAKKNKAQRAPKSIDQLLSELPNIAESKRAWILQLGRMYEAKHFLPNLRDVESFLRRASGKDQRQKSRKEAFPMLVSTLAELPEDELQKIIAHTDQTGANSDFSVLASALMGKRSDT
jgi:hypothetical protein